MLLMGFKSFWNVNCVEFKLKFVCAYANDVKNHVILAYPSGKLIKELLNI